MKQITPCIWLDNEAEEAANFYVSIFPNSKITGIDRYITESPSNKPIGSVLTVAFELNGSSFMTLNGGPEFKANEAISFIVPCKDQEEIDYYYEKLSHFPESEICGWLKDKYGVSWQLVPENYEEIVANASEEGKKRVMEALLEMKRINVSDLEQAARA
jgi:predicted 3-demethylubiquinone-9 3-methyltransferase (glyoxalase superfamily)